MPIRARFANGSKLAAVSFHTRSMMAPTVRQGLRISSVTALLAHRVASQAICWSKIRVWPHLVAGPWHCRDGDSKGRAAHPRGFGYQIRLGGSQVHAPPPFRSFAAVIARAASRADPAAVAHGFQGRHPRQQDIDFRVV